MSGEDLTQPNYNLIDNKEDQIESINCPEPSFPWFYKLWRVQGYYNLLILKCYPIIQVFVIAFLGIFLIYLDYSTFIGFPLKPITTNDGTLPAFFDFFVTSRLRNVLVSIVGIFVIISLIYYGYKLYKIMNDENLLNANKFFNDRKVLSVGGDWNKVKRMLRYSQSTETELDPEGFTTSTLIMTSGYFDGDVEMENDSESSESINEIKDVKQEEGEVKIEGLEELPKKSKQKEENLFIKRCTLSNDLMSKLITQRENELRKGSRYLYKIIKDIYFPNKEIDFYKSLIQEEHKFHIPNVNQWKERIKNKVNEYKRWYIQPIVLIKLLYNLIVLCLKYFGILLSPSLLLKKQWTYYSQYLLRQTHELGHETEVRMKSAEDVIEGIISLTPIDQFNRAIMRNLRAVFMLVFVVFFTLNIRSEFQLFGISSAVICNILLTIVVLCYDSSQKEIQSQTYDSARDALTECFPQLKNIVRENSKQKDVINYIKKNMYKELYQCLIDEIIAPLKVYKILKQCGTNSDVNEILQNVIKPVIEE
ncbi:hypothetical protein CL6EHI_072010 [Entamoeba histolytica]|uniref:Autophagy-related protein 9 n=4 Tax=Entamoeba histolytica TaxID=5759 RepID=C4M606_ENTH1|nr:hypothetical protein EHI_072010 [Entamoeba histolytica HM-1:IMSS]EAL48078.2 hypothetical protein EHI_072010 [Entamoeba histolytica HM-1:IMSS]GAT96880.1 hypothetical protein CL6EHI_072010 [Entamoeba histolytica]|eukprot:XP_653465.2 hypothetical protein EHI_072010 [Entamoeba histolytica HM-1:IMSS]